VSLPAGSSIGCDLFRCVPYGAWCQFIAVSSTGAASLYNVSVADASIAGAVPLPAADSIVSLHVDHTTGTSYFTALSGGGGGAAVLSVSRDGDAAVAVDLSTYLFPGSTIRPGGATHCSNQRLMWVAISNATAGLLLTLDLARGGVTAETPLAFGGFDGMWADCSDVAPTDVPAGTLFTDGASPQLAYGEVGQGGVFSPLATGKVPVGYVPNGLLTFSSLTGSDAYIAPLYPTGSTPSSKTGGFLAAFNNPGPSMDVTPISFYLAGASIA